MSSWVSCGAGVAMMDEGGTGDLEGRVEERSGTLGVRPWDMPRMLDAVDGGPCRSSYGREASRRRRDVHRREKQNSGC